MVSRAVARYIRVSPRKTRKVIGLIRGLPVVRAEAILNTINKRPTIYIKRLLHSALDSADKRLSIPSADLYISSITADQGPTLKRYRAATMGRATMIKHRTSHITLELEKIKRPEKKKDIEHKPKKKGHREKEKPENVKATKGKAKKSKTRR
ncbi:50S ribosomal protein L22 [Candidatus Omnitrophota bacterium]